MRTFLLLTLAAVVLVVSAKKDGEDKGSSKRFSRGRRLGPEAPPLPDFLKGLSVEAKKEYFDIAHNGELVIKDQTAQLTAWADKKMAKKALQDEYVKFREAVTANEKDLTAQLLKLLSTLGDIQDQKTKIYQDTSLSHKQRYDKLDEIFRAHPVAFQGLFAMRQALRNSSPIHAHEYVIPDKNRRKGGKSKKSKRSKDSKKAEN
ncbi:unnamed protein product [Caenorhabditis auriculariae]|uniref:SXP/RAL-2 family protein Ani s 5-like cation-binding domain-containing protein n=1 Tax=Caenorhabditis auriculariae TaxID=2777116 RepID=A0A8S1HVQ1_9PELO|nr:unnamed protein product [Caenorhabditis auriculariae]